MRFLEMLFVLAILAMIFGFPLAMMRQKHKGREREALDETERHEMMERLAQIEERIRVLERIVTDERAELRRQFREL